MLKIMNLNEIENVSYPALKAYISEKVQEWKNEYEIETLDEIGCFVLLNSDEKELFKASEMEFTEVLKLENETYQHGVKMLGDYIICACAFSIRPIGTLVETSLGTGICLDTGSFAYSDPYLIDIATAW